MYYFIINPNTSNGKGKRIWYQIEPILRQRNVKYIAHLTKHRGHAVQLARDISNLHEACTIVALGGDGTLNEIINGVEDFDKITLGYIPAGSGNDFARGVDSETDPLKAIDVVLSPKTIGEMDIGVMQQGDKRWRFSVSAGMGFDAAVCHQAAVSKLKKVLNRIGLGKLTYLVIALQRIISDSPTKVEMTLADGTHKVFEKVFFITVMNTPYEGGGFKFCPDAVLDDGKLNILVTDNISRLRFLILLPLALKGKHIGHKGMYSYQAEKATFVCERPMMLHADGEPFFLRRNIIMEVLGKKLKIIRN